MQTLSPGMSEAIRLGLANAASMRRLGIGYARGSWKPVASNKNVIGKIYFLLGKTIFWYLVDSDGSDVVSNKLARPYAESQMHEIRAEVDKYAKARLRADACPSCNAAMKNKLIGAKCKACGWRK